MPRIPSFVAVYADKNPCECNPNKPTHFLTNGQSIHLGYNKNSQESKKKHWPVVTSCECDAGYTGVIEVPQDRCSPLPTTASHSSGANAPRISVEWQSDSDSGVPRGFRGLGVDARSCQLTRLLDAESRIENRDDQIENRDEN